MFKNYKIVKTEPNINMIKAHSSKILTHIIVAYNECNSPDKLNDMTNEIISILESHFEYGFMQGYKEFGREVEE